MDTFHEGDLVNLKSGGPCMLVTSIDASGMVGLTWFDKTNNLQNASLPARFLRKAIQVGHDGENDPR